MYESELLMQSYEAMNKSTWIWNFWDLEEKQPPDLGFTVHRIWIGARRSRTAGALAGAAGRGGRRGARRRCGGGRRARQRAAARAAGLEEDGGGVAEEAAADIGPAGALPRPSGPVRARVAARHVVPRHWLRAAAAMRPVGADVSGRRG